MQAEAGEFWDAQTNDPVLARDAWTSNPVVQHYLATSMEPEDPHYPVEMLRRFLRVAGMAPRRGLSIGCGSGVLERVVLENSICETIDAFDAGVFSLATARRSARESGLATRVRYFAADFNTIAIPPRTYDIVFFNQSLHHVTNLEGLLDQVLRALKPDGILYIDEYVGPSRTQWSIGLLAPLRLIHRTLPAEWRKTPMLERPVLVADPSEAVRSGEIRKLLEVGFVPFKKRDYGGNLLSVLYPAIRWDNAPPGLVRNLLDGEQSLLASGQPSFYTVWLCRPKRGTRKIVASLHYRIRPLVLGALLHLLQLTRLPAIVVQSLALAWLLVRHRESHWPSRILRWLESIAHYRRFRDVALLVGTIEEIRDASRGHGGGAIGGVFLAHDDERFLVTPEEAPGLNLHVQQLSRQLADSCERMLASLRAHIVGTYPQCDRPPDH